MPLVFVHGVNVRKRRKGEPAGQPTAYDRAVERRDAFLTEIVLKPIGDGTGAILNPYWGDDAAAFPWEHGAIPDDDYEVFGAADNIEAELLTAAVAMEPLSVLEEDTPEAVLPWLAQRSFPAAVDLLVMTAVDPRAPLGRAAELARLTDALGGYAAAHADQPPDWVENVQSDTQFVDRLSSAVRDFRDDTPRSDQEWESFGVMGDAWGALRGAADRIQRAAATTARSAFRSKLRAPLHKQAAQFLGDVFIYLKRRDDLGDQEPILKTVLADLDRAWQISQESEQPLIVIGHSMGGNILYDCLTRYRPAIKVDLFLTVGSQLAVFEELKLFSVSDGAVPSNAVPQVVRPDNVDHWLNVFDHADVLGFAAGKVFAGVEDFEFDTGKWLLGAHGAYFDRASFYHRLGKRVRELGLGP